ncbi:PLP-dependent aminotransferase family protein [Pseudolabrys sp. FHR47]|uniref:MocR-like pyridoxine biosynthesis transcription factor PdxR n=1 Tax=Pseudolabrys sp. FHR47 TaxID=2562284 RepID=UPI001FEF069B|nr:PLP-dependent aminotransferase family protein [Pseudolabrys sp. FHR47]
MVKRAGGALLQSIAIDREASHGLSVQICAHLRELIMSGSLEGGGRLPSTRTLANELNVARATIVECFDQLAAEGLIESRVGAGTYVSQALKTERPPVAPQGPVVSEKSARLAQSMASASSRFVPRLVHEPRAFTTAIPAYDAFPMAQWARLSGKHWREARKDVLGYPDPHGHDLLRKAIAGHLRTNRGIRCDWQQIFIVAGAQQAFQLIASTLIDPGDKVWFEDPGAIGARNSIVVSSADLVPVRVDDDGLDVEDALRKAPDFRLAFVTPSHQQPLGVSMALERRVALLAAAEQRGAWIIEDDWDGEFCFSGLPMPTLQSMDQAGRVIYVGSFSKSLFPSLRLGFILAPPALTEHFRTSLEAFLPGVPTAIQAIVADFIVEGHFATHIRRMRKAYHERYQTLYDGVQKHLGDVLDIRPATTGMHTVAYLAPGFNAEAVARRAAERGVTLTPIGRFCIAPNDRQGFALGFSGFSPAQIEAGIATLKDVFAELSPAACAKSA